VLIFNSIHMSKNQSVFSSFSLSFVFYADGGFENKQKC